MEVKFNKTAGGWLYLSECGRFHISNLKKVDSDLTGWEMRDNNEYIGVFKTLKIAKSKCVSY